MSIETAEEKKESEILNASKAPNKKRMERFALKADAGRAKLLSFRSFVYGSIFST